MLYYIGKVKVHRKPTKHKLEPFSYTVYDSDTKEVFFLSKTAVFDTFKKGMPIKGLVLAKTHSTNDLPHTKGKTELRIMEESKGKYFTVNSPIKLVDVEDDLNYSPIIDMPVVIRTLRVGTHFRYKTLDVLCNSSPDEGNVLTLYVKYNWASGTNADLYRYNTELEELYWCLKQYNTRIKKWIVYTPIANSVDLHIFLPLVNKYNKTQFTFCANLQGTTQLSVPNTPKNMDIRFSSTTQTLEYLDIREFIYDSVMWTNLLNSIQQHTCLTDDCVILTHTDDLATLVALLNMRIPFYTYYCCDGVHTDNMKEIATRMKTKYALMHKGNANERRCFILNIKE